jgi:hypothetical protein
MNVDELGRAGAQVTRESLIGAWGGGSKGRAGLARRMAGVKPDVKLPRKGSKARKRYDAAMRGLQRAEGGVNPRTGLPKQTRTGAKKTQARIERIVKRERSRAQTPEENRLQTRGGRFVGKAMVQISRSKKTRDFSFSLNAAEWSRIIRDARKGKDAALKNAMLRAADLDGIGHAVHLTEISGRISPD